MDSATTCACKVSQTLHFNKRCADDPNCVINHHFFVVILHKHEAGVRLLLNCPATLSTVGAATIRVQTCSANTSQKAYTRPSALLAERLASHRCTEREWTICKQNLCIHCKVISFFSFSFLFPFPSSFFSIFFSISTTIEWEPLGLSVAVRVSMRYRIAGGWPSSS